MRVPVHFNAIAFRTLDTISMLCIFKLPAFLLAGVYTLRMEKRETSAGATILQVVRLKNIGSAHDITGSHAYTLALFEWKV